MPRTTELLHTKKKVVVPQSFIAEIPPEEKKKSGMSGTEEMEERGAYSPLETKMGRPPKKKISKRILTGEIGRAHV